MNRERRQRAEQRGRKGEHLAGLWLACQGWRILARRARTPLGEIDLVMARGRTLAFVEVKWRAAPEDAPGAFHPRQQQRLMRAAALWRARRPDLAGHAVRFDLICLSPGRWPRHLKGVLSAQLEEEKRLI